MIAIPTSAEADVVPCPSLRLADNEIHTYFYTTGFNSFRAVADYAMDTLDSTTDMVSQLPETPEFCEFRQTDVWWWSTNLAAGVRGQMSCAGWYTNGRCWSYDIDLDFTELDQSSLDWEDRQKTACHELGHTLSISHNTTDGAGSCMISGEIPNANLQYRRYSSHHISHIAALY